MRATGTRHVAALFVASKCGVNNMPVQPEGVLGALLAKEMHEETFWASHIT